MAPSIDGNAFPGPSWGLGAGTCRDGSTKAAIAVERAPKMAWKRDETRSNE